MDVAPFCTHYAELLTSFSGYCKHLLNLVNASWLSRISRGIWAKQKRGNILNKQQMSLPEMNVIYVLLIKWAYSSWQKHKCFVAVLSRYHIFHRSAISKRYVSFFKILCHLLFKVSRATNKGQNVWNIWTKVSDETCCSGRRSSEAGKVSWDPRPISPGVFFKPLQKIRISRTK